jgi:hypothetical protein
MKKRLERLLKSARLAGIKADRQALDTKQRLLAEWRLLPADSRDRWLDGLTPFEVACLRLPPTGATFDPAKAPTDLLRRVMAAGEITEALREELEQFPPDPLAICHPGLWVLQMTGVSP